jgi:hypothetical protein
VFFEDKHRHDFSRMSFSAGEMCSCGMIRRKGMNGGWQYDYSQTVQRFWVITNSGRQYAGLPAFILITSQYLFHLPVGKVKNFFSRSEQF